MEKIERKFKEENLENCFTYFNKVEKDGEFNQILESFDLIWGAYENFLEQQSFGKSSDS